MKKGVTLFLTVAFALSIMLAAHADEADMAFHSTIARYMKDYQYELPPDVQAQIIRDFEPQTADCGQVQVRFEEMLYDGQWLYTVASVTPTDPATTLVIPGEAGIGERISNDDGDDSRTYRTAAKEDRKELIGVYVYPMEFEGLYFVDHYRESDGTTFLLSGSKIGTGNTETTATWQVKVYHIDPDIAEYTLLQTTTYPMTIQPPQTYIEKEYAILDTELQLFQYVKLVQTSLNTYLFPEWIKAEDDNRYSVTLLEADGHDVEYGAPPDMESYQLEQFPESLTLEIIDAISGEKVGIYDLALR